MILEWTPGGSTGPSHLVALNPWGQRGGGGAGREGPSSSSGKDWAGLGSFNQQTALSLPREVAREALTGHTHTQHSFLH